MKESSGKTPAALLEQPRLTKQENYYFRIFNELSGSRGGGDGIKGIPQSELKSYFETWYINDINERENISYFVKELDVAYIDYSIKKMEDDRRAGGK